jgi:hypothetical protein
MTPAPTTWLLAVLLASTALGQARPPEERRSVAINEIERGFFFEARGGFWAVINPPTATGGVTYFSPGQAAQIDVGFDLGELVSPSVFLLATGNRMRSDYTGTSGGTASGDYGALMPGAALKVRLLGLDDAQGVRRTWIYVRAAGAAVFYNPTSLIDRLDVLVSGGVGLEYFTRLRHFSLGIEGNFNYLARSGSLGFSVFPTVKYSF